MNGIDVSGLVLPISPPTPVQTKEASSFNKRNPFNRPTPSAPSMSSGSKPNHERFGKVKDTNVPFPHRSAPEVSEPADFRNEIDESEYSVQTSKSVNTYKSNSQG